MRTTRRPLTWRCASVALLFASIATMDLLKKSFGIEGEAILTRRSLSEENSELSHYPDGLSPDNGVVVLYLIGVLYMFLALALVCDEFFVPTLEFMCYRFKIPEDVAGATFMAAGGSAPELATSFLGLFVSESNVGIGTIIGSAAFNVLFVIGICSIVSKELLVLTWFPLVRDCSFYFASLILLAVFFSGNSIYWYESLVLLFMYFFYVFIMYFNGPIRTWVEGHVSRISDRWGHKSQNMEVSDGLSGGEDILKVVTDPGMLRWSKVFQQAVLKILLHQADSPSRRFQCAADILVMQKKLREVGHQPVDPEGRGVSPSSTIDTSTKNCPEHQSAAFHALENEHPAPSTGNEANVSSLRADANNHAESRSTEGGVQLACGEHSLKEGECSACGECVGSFRRPESQISAEWPPGEFVHLRGSLASTEIPSATTFENGDPMDLAWPHYEGKWAKIWYLVKFPICVLLYFTLADIREDSARVYFVWTFFGSIIWVAVFSYLMVWWTTVIGIYINLSTTVLGITLLAAGTSIPDLITSVIVARKGYGDMALSSSIGSNLFDITVGLPLPWIIYSIVHSGRAVTVDDTALGWQVGTLVLLVLLTILTIAVCRWRLTYILGGTLLVLYALYIAQAFIIEFVWTPPF